MKLKWTFLLAITALLPGLLCAQDEPKKGKQKIVIIKRSVDENGNKVVEKIIREGEEDEVMEWEDEDGNVIIKPGSGEVIEWNGMGDLPEGLEESLEGQGFHFRSLDGEDFTFAAPPNKALLGVQVGQTKERVNENGEVQEVEVPEGEGAAVMDVFEGSAAEEAGIRKGDIITSIDGAAVENFKGLVDALSSKVPGDKVSVGLSRDGQPITVEAILKGRETAPSVFKFRMDDDEEGHQRHRRVIILKDQDVTEEDEVALDELHSKMPSLELEAFEAFPNPAKGQLTVRFTGEQAPVTIRLLDAAGKQVYREYIRDFGGKYEQQIGLEGVPEGMLLLTIEQEGRIFVEKIMIARQ